MLYFIINEQSGGERITAVWGKIREILEREQIDYRAEITKYPGHAADLAREFENGREAEIGI
ncbi:MAG: diacylglycerol kinase family lipid kinase, partial [Roseburia sp.]|nr:diacylglycerol kinase family lipid kinase [Roseburia sp.]